MIFCAMSGALITLVTVCGASMVLLRRRKNGSDALDLSPGDCRSAILAIELYVIQAVRKSLREFTYGLQATWHTRAPQHVPP